MNYDTKEQPCPLCDQPAIYELHDFDRRKLFKCPTCTVFCITADIEQYPEMKIEAYRKRFSEMAQHTPEGQVLELSSKGLKLSAEYIPRSSRWLQ
jgi:hypothetical protein